MKTVITFSVCSKNHRNDTHAVPAVRYCVNNPPDMWDLSIACKAFRKYNELYLVMDESREIRDGNHVYGAI